MVSTSSSSSMIENPTSPNKAEIITFGCRLNIYESEVIRNLTQDLDLTNTVIINTCAVTTEAERQARQTIRKIHRNRPSTQIIVTGCGAQMNPAVYAAMPEVSRVIGNQEKLQKESFVVDSSHPRVMVNDIMSVRETANHLIGGFTERARAFIQVQNGCDHRCTYCAIPYGRGNSRSVPIGAIVEQVNLLIDQGCREVVLTGVDITSYGNDLPGSPTLGQMIRRLLMHVPSLPRLRLSSVDPVEIDRDIFLLLAEEPRLMPHLHISLQAGDDMILKRMKRRHLRQDVIDFCERVRAVRPDVVFGADIIAGFPTETETMFNNTHRLIEECGFVYLHVFPYSPRPGTPAARMPQVDRALIKERAALLRKTGSHQQETFMQRQIGQKRSVLIEKNYHGYTEHFAPVKIDNRIPGLEGKIASVLIERYDQGILKANIL